MKRTILAALLALPLLGCGPELGSRNLTIPLTYLDGESNAGPMNATGEARIDTGTGLVEIDVRDLPLEDGTALEGWLAGGGETAESTNVFFTDADGSGSSTIELGDITMNTYTKVVVTIEPDPDSDPAPDSRHSVAGLIPAPEDE